MTVEKACMRAVRKPWGSTDLRPWSEIQNADEAVGELWFQRLRCAAPESALLLKLLFTQEPLSIQVHPDDEFAKAVGSGRGKTEAWYILSAKPGAQVAVGLKREIGPAELRTSIEDGSISQLVQWHPVTEGDVIFVPAGTIHAIGPGLVVAEIQQRSDTTFRLYDYGRERELHIDEAVAAARAGPAARRFPVKALGDARTLLLASPQFILERIDLVPNSTWRMRASRETWVLILDGAANLGSHDGRAGQAYFAEDDDLSINVGDGGLKALVAYLGPQADPNLLTSRDRDGTPAATPQIPARFTGQSAQELAAPSMEPLS
jgi:mannose-6-phosphate isomerase